MGNLRERIIFTINSYCKYNDKDALNAEKLTDYLMEEIEELSEYVDSHDMTIGELVTIVKYVAAKNNIRNLCILYCILVYGMKRDNVQNLKWSQFVRENGELMYKYGEGDYCTAPVPNFLEDSLNKLKQYYKERKINSEYVFCIQHGETYVQIGTNVINNIFSDLKNISDKYLKYTPTYIRRNLPMLLLLQGCRLEQIMAFLNIGVKNLDIYLGEKDMDVIYKNDTKPRIEFKDFWESFIEKCR